MDRKQSSQKGQVLVLLVLGFVVLLGFAALAIDGGMVYSDRRHAQNAADASSLAGGSAAALGLENSFVDYEDWNCTNPSPTLTKIQAAMAAARAAAISRALDNGYTIDEDISDHNGVATRCGVDNTGTWIDKYVDITTTITTDTRTNFVHIIFRGPLRNTVTAVTRVRPQIPLTLGYAVVAMRPDCPNNNTGGVHFDGTNVVTVNGGGVFSNACMVAGGSSLSVVVNGGGLACTGAGCYSQSGNPSISPPPVEASAPLPSYSFQVPPPDCSTLPNRGNHNGGGTIDPGRYGRIRVTSSSAELVLRSGLYCISNEFTMNGGTVRVEPLPNGDEGGVTIYLTGGDFNVAGNVHVELTAPATEYSPHPCNSGPYAYCPPALPGMLIYLAPGNTGEVYVTGNSGSFFKGTIYAPSGTIEAGGGTMEEVNAQLIGDTVFVHGNTTVNVNFDNAINYRPPSMLELYR